MSDTIQWRGEEWEVCPLESWQYPPRPGDTIIAIRRKPKPPRELWLVSFFVDGDEDNHFCRTYEEARTYAKMNSHYKPIEIICMREVWREVRDE